MNDTIARLYNNMPMLLQSAVIDAHIPAAAKTDADALIQAECILIGLFTLVNPVVVITKQETGALYCHVSPAYTQIIQDKIKLLYE